MLASFLRVFPVMTHSAKRLPVAYHIGKFRVFVDRLFMVRYSCPHRQPIGIQTAISPALFAQTPGFFQHLFTPYKMALFLVMVEVWHTMHQKSDLGRPLQQWILIIVSV